MATYTQTVQAFRNELKVYGEIQDDLAHAIEQVRARLEQIDGNVVAKLDQILDLLLKVGPPPKPDEPPPPGPTPPTGFPWPEHTAGMTFEQAVGDLQIHKNAADRQAESANIYEEICVEIGVKFGDQWPTLRQSLKGLIEGVLRNRGLL